MSDQRPHRAYFSLGSNIDAATNLPAAARELSRFGRVAAVSRVWESPPFRAVDRPNPPTREENFLNAAVLLQTDLSAEALCTQTAPAIEHSLGRVRDPHDKSAPRTIDIDLVLFNRDVLTIGHRLIPDPDILTRAFVAVPLAEVDPDYLHPTAGRSLAQIAAALVRTMSLHLRADVVLQAPKMSRDEKASFPP